MLQSSQPLRLAASDIDAESLLRAVQACVAGQRWGELSQAIRRLVSLAPDQAARHRVRLAHLLLCDDRWREISQLLPEAWNSLVASGWIASIIASKPVNAMGEPIPWFTYPMIELLDRLVQPAWRVFEWGSGHSTVWWAKRTASVHAVEHDKGWAEHVRPALPANARIELGLDEASYVGAIARAEGPFDVIVIDGEHRVACAAVAVENLAPSGIIVFDNSDRRRYHEGIERLDAAGLVRIDLFGLTPSFLYKNCSTLFLRDARTLALLRPPSEPRPLLGPTVAQCLGE